MTQESQTILYHEVYLAALALRHVFSVSVVTHVSSTKCQDQSQHPTVIILHHTEVMLFVMLI